VSTDFFQRALALGAAALLAGVLAVAIAARSGSAASSGLPAPVGAPGGDWYGALAGVAVDLPRRSACGYRISSKTLGVAHPVLPCGAQIYVAYGSKRALTQVVAHGLSAPGRELELTRALAAKLGLDGVRQVRWAYARD
jgi:hypothetical protein